MTDRYNYTGTLYFDVSKNRSFKSIASTAKEILKEGLPIQCLEAVFLGAYLTAGILNLDRFPISFKTTAGATTHRHIVLGIHHHRQKWGALGLSRCDKLMNKDLKYDSLSELILDYCHEFENVYHHVLKVNVGFPFTHDIHSSERVQWRVLNVHIDSNSWTDTSKQIDSFGKDAVEIYSFKKANGTLPAWFGAKYNLSISEVEIDVRSPHRRRNSLSDDFNAFEEELHCQDIVSTQKPRIVHIIVSPDEITFKRPRSRIVPAPPTNIFVQNTSPSPFLIEIEDNAGLLEVVTKTQPTVLQTGECDSKYNSGQSPSIFHISAKGMIVVAMKYNPQQSQVKNLTSLKESLQTKSPKEADNGIRRADESFGENYVLLSCTPMTYSCDNLLERVPGGEIFTLKRPFTLLDI